MEESNKVAGEQILGADDLRKLANTPVSVSDLLEDLAPPRHFETATFTNYRPDPAFPSQREAVGVLQSFTRALDAHGLRRVLKGLTEKLAARSSKPGVYLDGGFGIGKTHLLAASYHATRGPKAFLSFQELMFLVGLQGLERTVATLGDLRLLVIDEFELDDPANTRISTNLLGRLFDRGVAIITSSNTAPGALGEGKFSLDSFRREMGGLFDRFLSIQIDGEDYRLTHRLGHSGTPNWASVTTPLPPLEAFPALVVSLDDLLDQLAAVHPIRIRKAMSELRSVQILDVHQITHPHEALRFVYFVDKAYDDNIVFQASSELLIEQLFSPAIFHGGDTKKYLRCRSRLEEMTGAGAIS